MTHIHTVHAYIHGEDAMPSCVSLCDVDIDRAK